MGGRVAEEIFLGDVNSGVAGDIGQVTRAARAMVCDWGMSDKLGMVQYGDDHSMNFFGRDMGGPRGYSEKTAEAIDAEVLNLVNSAYTKAQELILSHKDAVERITAALLEYETLDGKHIRDIITHGRMLTPPPRAHHPAQQSDPQGAPPRQSPPSSQPRTMRHAPRSARPGGVRLISPGVRIP